jgi:hypothetical protein
MTQGTSASQPRLRSETAEQHDRHAFAEAPD